MISKFKAKYVSLLIILLFFSSTNVNSEDEFEFVFYEGLSVGDEIEWEIKKLSYFPEEEYININESQGDKIKFKIIKHPNDVIYYPEPDYPFASPSYDFREFPYRIYLNETKIKKDDLYFVPSWRNYAQLIGPIYYNSTQGEYNIFENEYEEWKTKNHVDAESDKGDQTYLNYTYHYDYSYVHTTYCSITNNLFNYTVEMRSNNELYFYDIDKQVNMYSLAKYSRTHDIKTGILQTYRLFDNTSYIEFYEDYIDFNPIEWFENFQMSNTEPRVQTNTIYFNLFIPIFTYLVTTLFIIRRKSRTK